MSTQPAHGVDTPFVQRYLRLFWIFFLPALAARATAFFAGDDAFGLYAAAFSRGLLSDVTVAALLALPLARFSRRVAAVPVLLWCLLLGSNCAFVLAHGANLQPEFLSEAPLGLPYFAVFLLLAAFTAWSVRNKTWRGMRRLLIAGGVLVLFAQVFMPPKTETSGWLQQNPVEESLRTGFRGPKPPPHWLAKRVPKRYFRADFNGQPRLPLPQPLQNILIVMPEQLSQWHVREGKAPFLASLREESLYFPHFINLSARAVESERALLCGEYPDFRQMRGRAPSLQACLPQLLQRFGYDVIPAARLSALEAVEEAVKHKEQAKPWFMAVRVKQGPAEADETLKTVVSRLRAEGVLEKTLVVFVGLQSGVPAAKANMPSGHLVTHQGLLFMLLPDGTRGRAEEYFTQGDLTLSLLDYLGLPSGYSGRSVLRMYRKPRPIVFADIYQGRFYVLHNGDVITACDRRLKDCRRFVNGQPQAGLFGGRFVPTGAKRVTIQEARTILLLSNDRNAAAPQLPLKPLPQTQNKIIYEQRDVAIEAGEVLNWEGKFMLVGSHMPFGTFWFEARNQATPELIFTRRVTVHKGKPQQLRVSFPAAASMKLALRGGVEMQPGMHVRVTQKRLSYSK